MLPVEWAAWAVAWVIWTIRFVEGATGLPVAPSMGTDASAVDQTAQHVLHAILTVISISAGQAVRSPIKRANRAIPSDGILIIFRQN